ncbi:MAG: hypothetical protein HC887_03535 [Desulfobacteraceae bacterium]|nr:hypothetical protein [Desulfobacteraceae bacterium]
MKYGFYLLSGGGLFFLQTSVIPYFQIFNGIYDILIPFILYLSIFCPFVESLLVAVGCGLTMDSLSGGPFGIFTTSYVWIFIGMKQIAMYVNISGAILISLLTMLGILIENAIIFGTFSFMRNENVLAEEVFFTVSIQLIWSACTGIWIIQYLKYLREIWDEHGWGVSAKAAGRG